MNDRSRSCEARQYSDQMNCQRCGLVWDMNDEDPPECLTDRQLSESVERIAMRDMKAELTENISREDFEKMWLGTFESDPREAALLDRLEQYYADTPSTMGNRQAQVVYLMFLGWCENNGYSRDDINRAKRSTWKRRGYSA